MAPTSPLIQMWIKTHRYLVCMKDLFNLTNSVDPDEMQHYAAFHLGLHCLQKYSSRGLSCCISSESSPFAKLLVSGFPE